MMKKSFNAIIIDIKLQISQFIDYAKIIIFSNYQEKK